MVIKQRELVAGRGKRQGVRRIGSRVEEGRRRREKELAGYEKNGF